MVIIDVAHLNRVIIHNNELMIVCFVAFNASRGANAGEVIGPRLEFEPK